MSNKKDIYIFIIYPWKKEQKEIIFKDKKNLIQNIHSEKNENMKKIISILKYTMKKKVEDKKIDTKKSKKEKVKIEFSTDTLNKETYLIEFDLEDKTFIYNPNLKMDGFYGSSKPIQQNKISNSEKLNIFNSVIEKESENNEIYLNLYKDSINVYGKAPSFEFLINIYVKIYKNLDMCKLLLKEFKKTLNKSNNDNISENQNLVKLKEIFQEISDTAENKKIIKENPDICIDYYGIILSYLHYYDFTKFNELINHTYAQDSNILFEILLTYKSYFKKNIKIDEKILDEFIKYCAGKTYNDLTKCLIYLKNLKIFLSIINNNKDKIIAIENFKPLSTNDLENKIDQKDINIIIDLLKEIILFSKGTNKLLIYIIDKFWENLINICNTSSEAHITLLSQLRNNFELYFELVTDLCKDKKDPILDNAKKFQKKDKFDMTLHNNIIEHIKNQKRNISNLDIINFIMKKDPIYFSDKNKDKRDCKILDEIDFEKIDDEFINEYKDFNIEIIFKKDIVKYLTTLFNKVKNWETFCNIYHLINDEN